MSRAGYKPDGSTGAIVPTAVAPDSLHDRDTINGSFSASDARHMKDSLTSLSAVASDTRHMRDALITVGTASGAGVITETRHTRDAGDFLLGEIFHTGTGDTQPEGNAWVDGSATQAGTHQAAGGGSGNFAASVLGARYAYFYFDLTGLSGLTVKSGGSHLVRWAIGWAAAVGQFDYSLDVGTFASRPFTQSTVTYNSRPADGSFSSIFTSTVASPGSNKIYLVASIPDATIASALSNGWLCFRLRSTGSADAIAATAYFRDNIDTPNSTPRIQFEVTR